MFDSGGAGLTAYTYDDDDDLLSTTRGFSGAAGVLGTGVATDYAYYPDGSLETMSFPGLGTQFHSLDSSFPSGNTPTYTYDYNGIGQLNGMTNPFGDKPGWGYLGNGWMSAAGVVPAGSSSNTLWTYYQYDTRGFMTDLTNYAVPFGTEFSDYGGATYDAAGDRLTINPTMGSSGPSAYSGSTSYVYDYLNELTQETTTVFPATFTLGYNLAGNATDWDGTTRTFNADDQLTGLTGVTYDGNGNPSEYNPPWGSSDLTYDYENRIASATSGGTDYTYSYDGDGVYDANGQSGTNLWFNINDVAGNPIVEFNSSGQIHAVNTWGANGLVGRYTRNNTYEAFYAYDMQGNTVQHVLSNGTVDNWIRYLADGEGRVSTQNTVGASIETYSNFGSQWGYRTDSPTGLEIVGNRFLDFNDGRWLTRDPIGQAGGVNT